MSYSTQDFKKRFVTELQDELNERRHSWVTDNGIFWFLAWVAIVSFCLAVIFG